jgi:hypothetical protein
MPLTWLPREIKWLPRFLARWERHQLREQGLTLFTSPPASERLLRDLALSHDARAFRVAISLLYYEWPAPHEWQPGGTHQAVLTALCRPTLATDPLLAWFWLTLVESPLIKLQDAIITEALNGDYSVISLTFGTKTTPVLNSGPGKAPIESIGLPASLNEDFRLTMRFVAELDNPILFPCAAIALYKRRLRPTLTEDSMERQVITLVEDPTWFARYDLTPVRIRALTQFKDSHSAG